MYKPTEPKDVSALERNQILEALEHILSTDKFLAAPQMSAFLRYVVEQAVSGNESRIKAYTVAVDALGKPDTFDPQNDPVVRVLAGRLRTCLKAYYDSNPDVPVTISMTVGTYVPSFNFSQADDQPAHLLENVKPISSALALRDDNRNASETGLDSGACLSEHSTDAQHPPSASANLSDPSLEQPPLTNPLPEPEIGAISNAGQSSTPASSTGDKLASLAITLFRSPVMAVVTGAVAVAMLTNHLAGDNQAEQPENSPVNQTFSGIDNTEQVRPRPDNLSVFVSAGRTDNPLESQLNTMFSGVFSESEELQVYRMLDPAESQHHWPEDYIVSLDVLPMPEETRVSVQLVNAATGHISHAETLLLSATASEGLSRGELSDIMAVARRLVSEDGPMASDYRSRIDDQGTEGG